MSKFYRINEHIQAPSLRVIGYDGEQLGVLTKVEALAKAAEDGLDLIEIAASAVPPVAKIIDFKKFKYEESKKERAARKGSGGTELKELWLSPRIADHDLGVRLRRADEFLKDGNKVKLTVKFKGREMGHQQLGYAVLKKALDHFGESAAVERESKFEGRKLTIIIGKNKGGNKDEQTEDKKIDTEKA
ncbi:MAG: translation initiation factor IF-3 [Candidatus Daviesbacteria bacterium]|nr:translation initiation factor IF-3 [Candidatus Daviesbacteria bacterium]